MTSVSPSAATQTAGRARTRARAIIGTRVDATSYADAVRQVVDWAKLGESRYLCCANVHMLMEAHDEAAYHEVLRHADLVTPDGRPLVWALRALGVYDATSVRGSELTALLCHEASREGLAVGFFGGSPSVLADLVRVMTARAPRLVVAYQYSPPFRQLTDEEEQHVIADINRSGARILFVGLGCPKQEWWMARHKRNINAVMLGTGAAFDFLAGHRRRASPWLQDAGLEWLVRLVLEPRRLWRRYLYHNPRYLALLSWQLLRQRRQTSRCLDDGREMQALIARDRFHLW
jgi:N-acetylglucosaminyldiphosphoundecaprenol N-acetyl-beta-D-mannosaminyltransferase